MKFARIAAILAVSIAALVAATTASASPDDTYTCTKTNRNGHVTTVAVECVLVTPSCGVPLRGLGFGLAASGLTRVRTSGRSAGTG